MHYLANNTPDSLTRISQFPIKISEKVEPLVSLQKSIRIKQFLQVPGVTNQIHETAIQFKQMFFSNAHLLVFLVLSHRDNNKYLVTSESYGEGYGCAAMVLGVAGRSAAVILKRNVSRGVIFFSIKDLEDDEIIFRAFSVAFL